MREVVLKISDSVRKGASFSAALDEHPRLFSKLYVSMVRVGEEAGALPKVMADLADLLEHEDEVRGEVVAAVAYPVFVLGFGLVTVTILLTVVLPKALRACCRKCCRCCRLPTLILLRVSGFLHHHWIWRCCCGPSAASVGWLRWYVAFAARRRGLGLGEAAAADDRVRSFAPRLWAGLPGRWARWQERRLAAARAEDRREHHRQPRPGPADRASGGGDARRGFAGRRRCASWGFSREQWCR